jgi:hypothetical protein
MADTTVPIELPVIDISNPHNPAVGKAMLDAAAKYGFLYVNSKGTDFTTEDVDHAFGLVRLALRLIDIYLYAQFLTIPIVKEVLFVSRTGEADMPDPAECL